MRIALVSPYAWDRPGGVQTHVRDLGVALVRRGHEVMVLAPRSSFSTPPAPGVGYCGLSIPIPANGSVAPISFGPGAWIRCKRVASRFRPDIVHVHEPLVPSVSLIATLRAEVPVVATFHASADRSLGYAAARPVLSRVARKLSARIAVSDAALALIRGYFPDGYVTIPNGADLTRFQPGPERQESGRTIVFVGRLEPRKGLEVLLRACARLGAESEVVVVGSGPEEGRCRTLARRAGLNVRFLGRVTSDELPAVLAGADVFCSPALGAESFGIVLIEAMAAGAPVVCSDLPGYRSAAGDAARYVAPGDDRALAEALSTVLGDPAAARTMRARGIERAARFDWSHLVPRIEAVYESALEGPGS